jgi:hypothetical protein
MNKVLGVDIGRTNVKVPHNVVPGWNRFDCRVVVKIEGSR